MTLNFTSDGISIRISHSENANEYMNESINNQSDELNNFNWYSFLIIETSARSELRAPETAKETAHKEKIPPVLNDSHGNASNEAGWIE